MRRSVASQRDTSDEGLVAEYERRAEGRHWSWFFANLTEVLQTIRSVTERRNAARRLGDDARELELTNLIRRANLAYHSYLDACRPWEEKEQTDDEKPQDK